MEFAAPLSREEAASILAERGEDARVLAGGTDLMLQYRTGEVSPGLLLWAGKIPGLDGIEAGEATGIGALTTHARLGSDGHISRNHPALAEAARLVGGWQTQAVGTVGGNVVNASPAADTVPPLLVAGAEVTLESIRGVRRLPLGDFLLDRRRTAREPDELLTRIDVASLPDRAGEAYLKVGRRGAMEVALVGLAVRLRFGGDDRVAEAAVAVCSMAPTPLRIAAAEQALVGSSLEGSALDAAADAVLESASPIDDARASASYRARVVRGLLARAAQRCREAAA